MQSGYRPSMSRSQVHFDKYMKAYRAQVRSKSKRIHVGYYKSEDEAYDAIEAYKQKHYKDFLDFNRLAKDPIAWNKEAQNVLMKLSNSPNASKVDRPTFSSSELEAWI